MNAAGGARQGILSCAIKDKAQLYSAYMPFLKSGGIFVPTPKRYFLGDEVFLLLTLPESSDRLPVAGKVVWVTPAGAQGNRAAGIGVQFAETSEGEAIKNPARLTACAASQKDAACAGTLITDFGRRAFRRPLTPEERERYMGLYTLGSEGAGPRRLLPGS